MCGLEQVKISDITSHVRPRISDLLIYFDSSGSVCHGATITISEYMSALKKKKLVT